VTFGAASSALTFLGTLGQDCDEHWIGGLEEPQEQGGGRESLSSSAGVGTCGGDEPLIVYISSTARLVN
jgi:hypothetical protein